MSTEKPKYPQYSTNWYIDILRDEDPERAKEEIAKLNPRERVSLRDWDDEQLIELEEIIAARMEAERSPPIPTERKLRPPETPEQEADRHAAERHMERIQAEGVGPEPRIVQPPTHDEAVAAVIRKHQGHGACRINGCVGGVFAMKLCSKHYHRKRQERSMVGPVKHDSCGESDCGAAHYSKGYCQKHYMRKWRDGEFDDKKSVDGAPVCRISGCGKKHYAKLYCRYHYGKFRAAELNEATPLQSREGARLSNGSSSPEPTGK